MSERASAKSNADFFPGDLVAIHGGGVSFADRLGRVLGLTKDGTRLWIATWSGKKVAVRPEELQKIRSTNQEEK